jgi:hypothetical protein
MPDPTNTRRQNARKEDMGAKVSMDGRIPLAGQRVYRAVVTITEMRAALPV